MSNTNTLGPAALAAELVELFHAEGLSAEDVAECLEDWTQGPFRDSDWPASAIGILRRVTPTNAAAVLAAADSFDGEG